MTDPLEQALSLLTPVLEELGIQYLIVGSLASSVHGVYRATADGDLLVIPAPGLAAKLAAALGPGWYADADMIERAIREKRSFNLIHMATSQKIDIFPAKTDFDTTEIGRARRIPVFPAGNTTRLPVASPEDVLLAKLQWYRAGGEISDRQWNDITGILAANPALDFDYVRDWAARLRVEDLLQRAIADVKRD